MLAEEKTYYAYRHIRPDINTPFYIGKGVMDKGGYSRAFYFKKRNNIWNKIFNKCNKQIKVEIFYVSKNHDEIIDKEIEFIKLYGRLDNNTGILSNLTDGGDGAGYGRKISETQKIKFRETIKKTRVWGKLRDEVKKKMSQSHKIYFEKNKEIVIARAKENAKKVWGDSEKRNALINKIKIRSNTPEFIDRAKENFKQNDNYVNLLTNKRLHKIKNNTQVEINKKFKHNHPHSELTKNKISNSLKNKYYRDTKIECTEWDKIEYHSSIENVSKKYRISVKKIMEIIDKDISWCGVKIKRVKKTAEEISNMMNGINKKISLSKSKGTISLYKNDIYIGVFNNAYALSKYLSVNPGAIYKSFLKKGDKNGIYKNYKFIKNGL